MYYEIVLAGVAISLLFVELTGLSPAGLIVPGYLALCLQTPWRIVYTLAVAVAAWGIAKLLGNVMILYGRRRFAVMVLLSFAIDLAVTSLGLLAYDPGMIGVLVPGIMAQELHPAVFSASVGPKLVQERSVCREQGPIPGDCVGEGVADLLQRGPHLRSVVQPDIGDDSDVRPHHPVL